MPLFQRTVRTASPATNNNESAHAAAGRIDLLAERAGTALGFSEGGLEPARNRQIAELCIAAGADKALMERWIAVGRLDINSSGLLLFTDSGELANRLMHPRYELEREYSARVQGNPDIEKLRSGVQLEDGPAAFDSIVQEKTATGTNRWYRVTLTEGGPTLFAESIRSIVFCSTA